MACIKADGSQKNIVNFSFLYVSLLWDICITIHQEHALLFFSICKVHQKQIYIAWRVNQYNFMVCFQVYINSLTFAIIQSARNIMVVLTNHRTIYTVHLYWWIGGSSQTPQNCPAILINVLGVHWSRACKYNPSSGILKHLPVTNKAASVQWVRPRARESTLGGQVFNKSSDVMSFLYSSSTSMKTTFNEAGQWVLFWMWDAGWNVWQGTIGHWQFLRLF